MVDTSKSIVQVKSDIAQYLFGPGGQSLSEFHRQKLADAVSKPSPVDAIVNSMEALQGAEANGGLDDAGRALIADCAYQVVAGGFHGKEDRANDILRYHRHKLGELKTAAPAVDALAEFMPTPAPSEEDKFNGADPAAFDHDKDGKPGGSLPHSDQPG